MRHVLERVFRDDLRHVFVRTGLFVLAALVGCCLIGYPVAYYVARSTNRSRGLLLALLVLPFWISYLMRMLAWVNLLQTDGYINRVLGWLQIGSGSRNWLDGDWPTVVMGLIYGYIPFFILPLYAALERLDERLHRGVARPRRIVDVDVPARHVAAVDPRADGGVGHRRAADVRRLLHQHLPHRRLAAHRDGRQPDRVLPARLEPAPDGRVARDRTDGVPDAS